MLITLNNFSWTNSSNFIYIFSWRCILLAVSLCNAWLLTSDQIMGEWRLVQINLNRIINNDGPSRLPPHPMPNPCPPPCPPPFPWVLTLPSHWTTCLNPIIAINFWHLFRCATFSQIFIHINKDYHQRWFLQMNTVKQTVKKTVQLIVKYWPELELRAPFSSKSFQSSPASLSGSKATHWEVCTSSCKRETKQGRMIRLRRLCHHHCYDKNRTKPQAFWV